MGKVAAAAIAGGEELAGVSRSGATVHQIQNRENQEKEENETNSFASTARSGAKNHREKESPRERGGEGDAHHGEKRGKDGSKRRATRGHRRWFSVLAQVEQMRGK